MHHQGGGLGKQYWYVACHRMTCLMDLETPIMDTEAEAIEAWNTRAERTCQLITTNTEAGYGKYCSECETRFHIEAVFNYCPNCGAKVIEEQ